MAKKKSSKLNKSTTIAISLIGSLLAFSVPYLQKAIDAISNTPVSLNSSCESNLLQGVEPNIAIEKMAQQSQQLCFEGYAARASYISKSNLYSAEYLTKARVSQKIKRENTFHEETQLPAGKRAELSDYRRSGFDRGHLAPSADMPTEQSQYESFSLANMVPQVAEHNQKTWSRIENITRDLAKKHGEIYVVTMPVYQNENGSFPAKMKAIGTNQVYIPQYMAKAIYVPKLNAATVIFSPNNDKNIVRTMSLSTFNSISKINVFPTLSQKVQSVDGGFFKW